MAERAQRWLFLALLCLLAVLALTGVWLTFRYRPSTVGAWNGLTPPGPERHISPARVVHFWAALLAVLCAIALFAATLIWRLSRRPRRASHTGRDLAQPAVLAGATVVVLLAFTVTGFLLPWDQIALWAVTVRGSFDGMLPAAFNDYVRFVIVDNAEVSQGAFRSALLAHTILLVVALAALGGVLARQRWRSRSSDSVS